MKELKHGQYYWVRWVGGTNKKEFLAQLTRLPNGHFPDADEYIKWELMGWDSVVNFNELEILSDIPATFENHQKLYENT